MSEEIQEAVEMNLPEVTPQDINPAIAMHQMAKTRLQVGEAIRTMAIQCTLPQDWIDYGGNPGIDGPAAERIARTFGLKSRNMRRPRKEFREDKNGQFYLITVEGEIGFGDEYIWIIGTCDSKKPFFAKRDGVLLPHSEVDENNIVKNALTNWWVNAVSRFLGLRGLTWEQVTEMSQGKINKGGAQRIDYGSSKGPDRSQEDTGKADGIWKMLLEMNGGVVQNAKSQLQDLTKFNDFKGYTDIKKVSAKVLPRLHSKIKKLYEAWGGSKEGNSQASSGSNDNLVALQEKAEQIHKGIKALNSTYGDSWFKAQIKIAGAKELKDLNLQDLTAFINNCLLKKREELRRGIPEGDRA